MGDGTDDIGRGRSPAPTRNVGFRGVAVLLTGTRVVEWAEGMSAPFCARLLADLGAEVVKIEPPGGDPLRRRGPFWPGETGADASALFAYVNAGKRSVTVDLGATGGAARLDAMLGGPSWSNRSPRALCEHVASTLRRCRPVIPA
jgi:hypothetical protein